MLFWTVMVNRQPSFRSHFSNLIISAGCNGRSKMTASCVYTKTPMLRMLAKSSPNAASIRSSHAANTSGESERVRTNARLETRIHPHFTFHCNQRFRTRQPSTDVVPSPGQYCAESVQITNGRAPHEQVPPIRQKGLEYLAHRIRGHTDPDRGQIVPDLPNGEVQQKPRHPIHGVRVSTRLGPPAHPARRNRCHTASGSMRFG